MFDTDSDKGARREFLQEQLPGALKQQLGLELRPAMGSSDQFLVIDHIERQPVAN